MGSAGGRARRAARSTWPTKRLNHPAWPPVSQPASHPQRAQQLTHPADRPTTTSQPASQPAGHSRQASNGRSQQRNDEEKKKKKERASARVRAVFPCFSWAWLSPGRTRMRHLPRARIERREGGTHPAAPIAARFERAPLGRSKSARRARRAPPPPPSLPSSPCRRYLCSPREAQRRTPGARRSRRPRRWPWRTTRWTPPSSRRTWARSPLARRSARPRATTRRCVARRGAVGVARERRAWWLWRCDVGTCHALGRGRAWQAPCAAAGEPGHSCSRAPRRMPRPRIEREHLRVGMARAVVALPSCASGDRRLRTGERARVCARTRCASADARTLPVACTRAFARLQQMEAEENAQAYVKAYQQVAIDEELGDVRARRAATLASAVQKSARAATVARCATCLASACSPVCSAARREARRRAELTAAFATHPRAHAPSRRRRPSRSCRSAA